MAKKKKKIMHVYYEVDEKTLCGLISARYDINIKNADRLLSFGDFRLCHKCKHIHEMNRNGIHSVRKEA